MDTIFVHDTITQIQTAIDTVLVMGVSGEKGQSLASIIFPLITFGITLLGWIVTYRLSQRTQARAFESAVMDRIRLELNGPLLDYNHYLQNLEANVDHLEKITHEDLFDHDDVIFENKINEVNEIFKTPKASLWFVLFAQYSIFFKNLQPAFEVMDRREREINRETQKFIWEFQDFSKGAKGDNALRIAGLIRKQITLRDQFFQFLQYECLGNLNRMQLPDFSKERGEKIIRDKSGMLSVVNPDRSDGGLGH